MRRSPAGLALPLIAALALSACSSTADGAAADDGLHVVATTSMLGSVVGQLTDCAGGTTMTLMPDGADPHDFTPSSSQIADVVRADAVVANGLGLEGASLKDALDSAAEDGATVLEAGSFITPRTLGADTDEGSAGDPDPHFWFDVDRMADAVQAIGSALAARGGQVYATCGKAVADDLRAAAPGIAATLASVPRDRRILVTDHDAFGYLAAKYGYTIAGAVIPSLSTLAEPSSASLATLARTIDRTGVPAIFANTSGNDDLAHSVADEVGHPVRVVDLYVESLGEPGSGADTYLGMLRTDASRIAAALGGTPASDGPAGTTAEPSASAGG